MIRPAALADAPRIAEVHVRCWEESYRGILPDSALEVTVEERARQWSRGLARADRAAFVFEREGRVDGFASVHLTTEEPGYAAMLSTLYVLKSAQRFGAGRALLGAAAEHLLARSIPSMWLLTLRDRNPARGFYERLGARLLREQPAPPELGAGVTDVVYAFDDLRVLIS